MLPQGLALTVAGPFPDVEEIAMPETQVEVKKRLPARTSPPDVLRSIRSEFDRLFDRLADFRLPSLRRMFEIEPFRRWEAPFEFATPAVDLSEDEKAYKITAELPGIDAKDVDVSVSGDMLVFKGEKHQEKEEKDTSHYLCERSYGAFRRAFRLPDGVDRDKVAADFAKGVLTITLPKTPEAQKQSKKIEIKAG
jgi:HSP20 family protein